MSSTALSPPPLFSLSPSSSRVSSREEIKFICFLHRVEQNWPHDDRAIAGDKRLDAYVKHMAEMLKQLESHPQ
jgi:hypothetical protein